MLIFQWNIKTVCKGKENKKMSIKMSEVFEKYILFTLLQPKKNKKYIPKQSRQNILLVAISFIPNYNLN